jgi:hypothetical protein
MPYVTQAQSLEGILKWSVEIGRPSEKRGGSCACIYGVGYLAAYLGL